MAFLPLGGLISLACLIMSPFSTPSGVIWEIHEEIPFFVALDSCYENVLVLNEAGPCYFAALNENMMRLLLILTSEKNLGQNSTAFWPLGKTKVSLIYHIENHFPIEK